MVGLTSPSIALDQAAVRLGWDAFRRGTEYARQGRVLQYQWSPDAATLVGTVRGNHSRPYATTAILTQGAAGPRAVKGGRCSCPMRVDCKHVAALIVAAGLDHRVPAAVTWQQSLEALIPGADLAARAGASARAATALGIELDLILGEGAARLEARVVRPGKRGGWVSGDVSWSVLFRLAHYGYEPDHVEKLRVLHALAQASDSGGYPHYSYAHYGVEKTIDLIALNSAQLWPLLADARRAGVALVQAGTGCDLVASTAQHVQTHTTNRPARSGRPV